MNKEEFKRLRKKSASFKGWTIHKERKERKLSSGSIVSPLEGALSMLAPYGLDLYDYCVFNCPYCTAKLGNRWSKGSGRRFFDLEKFDTPFSVFNLESEIAYSRLMENVLISPYCDPLQSEDLHSGRFKEIVELFFQYKIPVVILSKAGVFHEHVDFLFENKEKCKVGTTLLATNDRLSFLTEYEPGVPNALDRIADLGEAKKAGLSTFVVLLPVLSSKDAVDCINATLEYADDYFISGFLDEGKRQFPVDVCAQSDSVGRIVDALRSNNKRFYMDEDLRKQAPNIAFSYDEATSSNHWISKEWVFNELSKEM